MPETKKWSNQQLKGLSYDTMIIWAIQCIKDYMVPLLYDLTTFQILGQKFVKFFVGFLEKLRYQKDILKLTDLKPQFFECSVAVF